MRRAFAFVIACFAVVALQAAEKADKPTVSIKMSLPKTAPIDGKEVGGTDESLIDAEITITNKGKQAVDHAASDYKFKLKMKGGKEVAQNALSWEKTFGVAPDTKSIPAGESLTETRHVRVTELLKHGETYVLTCEAHGARATGRFQAKYLGSEKTRTKKRK